MAQFLKIGGKSQHSVNNIKLIMRITIIVIIFYSYFLFILALPESVAPGLNFLRTMNIIYRIPILLFFSVIFSSILYLMITKEFEMFTKLRVIICSIYLKMVKFNSFFLLPIFLFSIGFMFITFIYYNIIFVKIGTSLVVVGILLFYIVFLVKVYYEGKIYYMLYITNNILDDLSESKKDSNTIEKLNIYFKKTINNIDNKLGKNLNINNLKTDEDKISRVKSIIINYLPLYIEYGEKEQLDLLKNHVHSMSLLVEKNDDFNLNIIKIIIEIYNDIYNFINSKKFIIIEKERHDKLSIIKDNSYIIFGTFQLIIFMLYLYLYGPSPIP